ncbi:MAG: hypothetical protein H6Q17_2188 [Bacteroidetes bacterium]|nr:hypothetical protein [Bacteroidota bacterium]
MIQVIIDDYNKLKINSHKITFPKRIRQFVIYNEFVVILVESKKNDPEYGVDLSGGNIFFANDKGIFWQYPTPGFMSNIWKINENILGMYDGQSDLWLDVNKKEIVRAIWNPWGFDNPEKYK